MFNLVYEESPLAANNDEVIIVALLIILKEGTIVDEYGNFFELKCERTYYTFHFTCSFCLIYHRI